jgi:hypothetical protein
MQGKLKPNLRLGYRASTSGLGLGLGLELQLGLKINWFVAWVGQKSG